MSRTTTDTTINYDNSCIVCYDPLELKLRNVVINTAGVVMMKIDNKCAMRRTVLKEEKKIEDPCNQRAGLLDLVRRF
jgi:hypothetical protein